jgi:hypothetical protein
MAPQFADQRLPSTERRIIQRPKETCEVVHTGQKIDLAAENVIGSKRDRGVGLYYGAAKSVSTIRPRRSRASYRD